MGSGLIRRAVRWEQLRCCLFLHRKYFTWVLRALGILRGAPSIGAFLTATYLTHKPISKNAGVILLWSIGGFGLCMIGFGLSKNFYISLLLLALSGMLDGVSVFVRSTIFQVLTPNDMKGRVAAVNGIFIGSSNENWRVRVRYDG